MCRLPALKRFPEPLAHSCTAALPGKAGARHSLSLSKAPFAGPEGAFWLAAARPSPLFFRVPKAAILPQSEPGAGVYTLFIRLPKATLGIQLDGGKPSWGKLPGALGVFEVRSILPQFKPGAGVDTLFM